MSHKELQATWRTPAYRELKRDFDHLWAKYGYKSMVNDKRRRASTRRANSGYVRELRRAARRATDQKLRLEAGVDADEALWPIRAIENWSRAGRGP